MQKNYWLIGCLVFPLIALLVFFIGYRMTVSAAAPRKPVSSDTWLRLNPAGMVNDYNEIAYGFMGANLSVEEICTRIKAAAADKRVRGILIQPSFAQIGMAGINEIAGALKVYKQSGKPVLAHLEMQSQRDYMLACLADTIAMEPAASGGLFLEGVGANVSFYKNLLDKLGLKINVIQSGRFKGFGEAYSQTSLTPETYGNLREVLSDRYELTIKHIASRRQLSEEKVREIFELRQDYLVSADYAKQAGLVDLLAGEDDFFKRYGIEPKQLLSFYDYNPAQPGLTDQNKIAVCYLQGGIVPGSAIGYDDGISAGKVQKLIESVKADKQIKAVVLRINSPGGSALESELIYRKLESLRSELPIVVSMSGSAASGGYYISAPANYIMADPFTVTGSIGVIQLLPDASGLGRKIGISNQTIGFGKYAGAMNLMNTPSDELLASLQRTSDGVYEEFKQRVAKYRKIAPDSLEDLAGGRVWSAQDAVDNHLADQVGTLEQAVMKAAELAGVKSYQTVVLPRQTPYWEMFAKYLRNRQLVRAAFSLKDLAGRLEDQLLGIFKPYTALCVMPVEFD